MTTKSSSISLLFFFLLLFSGTSVQAIGYITPSMTQSQIQALLDNPQYSYYFVYYGTYQDVNLVIKRPLNLIGIRKYQYSQNSPMPSNPQDYLASASVADREATNLHGAGRPANISYDDDWPSFIGSDRGSGPTAIRVESPGVTIENLHVSWYRNGISVAIPGAASGNVTIKNCILTYFGIEHRVESNDWKRQYSGNAIAVNNPHHQSVYIRDTYAQDSEGHGYSLSSNNNQIENSKFFSWSGYSTGNGHGYVNNGVDYAYLVGRGNDNEIRDCHVEFRRDNMYSGHGFTVTGYWDGVHHPAQRNKIIGCSAIFGGQGILFRGAETRFNEVVDFFTYAGYSISLTAGPSDNTFDGVVSYYPYSAIEISNGDHLNGNQPTERNYFKNCAFGLYADDPAMNSGVGRAILYSHIFDTDNDGSLADETGMIFRYNYFINCTFQGFKNSAGKRNAFAKLECASFSNYFRNCIFKDFLYHNVNDPRTPIARQDLAANYFHCNFSGSDFYIDGSTPYYMDQTTSGNNCNNLAVTYTGETVPLGNLLPMTNTVNVPLYRPSGAGGNHSSVINKGTNFYATFSNTSHPIYTPDDIEGNTRLCGANCGSYVDIGAYEYNSANKGATESWSTELSDRAIDVQLYPNPASRMVTLEGPLGSSLALYDSGGKLILRQKLVQDTQQLDVSHLPAGLYHAVILSPDHQKFSKKLTISR